MTHGFTNLDKDDLYMMQIKINKEDFRNNIKLNYQVLENYIILVSKIKLKFTLCEANAILIVLYK